MRQHIEGSLDELTPHGRVLREESEKIHALMNSPAWKERGKKSAAGRVQVDAFLEDLRQGRVGAARAPDDYRVSGEAGRGGSC